MFSTDPFFDEQAMRTLVHTQFGGADFGECMVTMQRVPPGDAVAWHREWLATADLVAATGDACAAAGHAVSVREVYLRASNYYRTSYVLLFGTPTTPALVHAFERESATFAAFAERATTPLEAVEIPYEDDAAGLFLPGAACPGARAYADRDQWIRFDGP